MTKLMPLWTCLCCPESEEEATVQSTELHSSTPESKLNTPDEALTKSLMQKDGPLKASCGSKSMVVNMGDFGNSPDSYQLLAVIGKGSFDAISIFLAKHVPSGRSVAVKRVSLDHCPLNLSLIQNEIKMHRLLKHQNILPVLSSFTHKNEIWSVLPSMGYGSCRDLIHAHFHDGLPELAIAYVLRDVGRALEYLHTRAIIHRCIKASHILINGDGTVCLSGLRHCLSMMRDGCRMKVVHDFPKFYVYALNWASRELLEQDLGGYDTRSDIYSLGITACELANGVVPFQDMPLTEMLLSKIEGTIPRLLDARTLPEWPQRECGADGVEGDHVDSHLQALTSAYRRTFTPHFHDLTERCLYLEPANRPSATVLLKHAFFKQLRPKSTFPPLTELLKPLMPITPQNFPQVDLSVADLTDELEEVSVDSDEWIF